MRKAINVTRDRQSKAFELAREAVIEDAEEGLIDPSTYQGDIPDGEILRVISEAYVGELELSEPQ